MFIHDNPIKNNIDHTVAKDNLRGTIFYKYLSHNFIVLYFFLKRIPKR